MSAWRASNLLSNSPGGKPPISGIDVGTILVTDASIGLMAWVIPIFAGRPIGILRSRRLSGKRACQARDAGASDQPMG
jgi:hypothetical protein